VAPILSIDWDAEALGRSGADVAASLSVGDPRIEVFHHETGITVNPYMMEEGDEVTVIAPLRQALTA